MKLALQRFLNGDSHGKGHTDHGVATCALSPWEASVVGFLKLRIFLENLSFYHKLIVLCSADFRQFNAILWTNVDQKYLPTSL